jgi:hypothetical protein
MFHRKPPGQGRDGSSWMIRTGEKMVVRVRGLRHPAARRPGSGRATAQPPPAQRMRSGRRKQWAVKGFMALGLKTSAADFLADIRQF